MGMLDGKIALVTGAARGQGRNHAVRFAEEGADVIVLDVCDQIESVSYPLASREDLDETVALVEKHGKRAVPLVVDVRDGEAVQAGVKQAAAELGGLDVLVANAGIWAVAVDEPNTFAARNKMWRETIDINLTGVWNCVEAVAPIMVEQGRGGAMVFTNSIQGLKAAANNDLSLTAYTAAKHGLVGLLRNTAKDLAPHSIRCNSVHPTGVGTAMVANEVVGAYMEKHPQLADLMANALPVPAVDVDDITNAILFLVSDAGRYITGVTLPVDAGALL